MKLTSLALFASFAVAGYVGAQTTPQESVPAPAEKSHQHPLSSACRDEVTKLCGAGHSKEMMGCIKENTSKFSTECQSELKEHTKQQAKPTS